MPEARNRKPASRDAESAESHVTDLVLVRHGEALYDREEHVPRKDSGLTELGWLQAQRVADWVAANYYTDALISSSLIRARQTAEVIGQRVALPIRIQSELAEPSDNYRHELPTFPGAPLAAWENDWRPTAETAPIYTAFRARVAKVLADILIAHAGQTVVIVAHSSTIGTILRGLFGGHQMTVHADYGGITHLQWRDDRWCLLSHNVQEHLHGLPQTPNPATRTTDAPAQPPWAASKHRQAVVMHAQRVASVQPIEPPIPSKADLDALINMAALDTDARLLDVGTGTGIVACAFAPQIASAVGIDIAPAMLENAEKQRLSKECRNVQFRWAEASALPFPPHSFSVITFRDVLPYLVQTETVMANLHKVLTPEGKLLLDEIVGSDDPVKRATQEAIECRRDPSFLRAHSRGEIAALVIAAGFRIKTSEPYDVPRELDEWLAHAAADDATRAAVRSMVEASLEGDAAGMGVRQERSGRITLIQHRLRLVAVAETDEQSANDQVE